MIKEFFSQPILNSPYTQPNQHWQLDENGQPTGVISPFRRECKFVTPIPRPKKQTSKNKKSDANNSGILEEEFTYVVGDQKYDPTTIISKIRRLVEDWRDLPNPSDWKVSPETARLLQHWRHHKFSGVRPFFCQVEAVETLIWLTEVAPQINKAQPILKYLQDVNQDANPELIRTALKLATGAGKTTVMAMIIAWQTVNAVRHPGSKKFTRGFLIIAPGLTIKDRLRVLKPEDPDSYYASREIIPPDMSDDIKRSKIVITNYHAFKLRERIDISKGGRSLLQGRGEALNTLESDGQMIQRVMPDLMGIKNIMVINDEAHHCYREKPLTESEDEELKGDDKKEADKNNEAARLWISGIEAVNRQLSVSNVIDLSATPFFLRGSGYVEGTLFPWTVSDFSLMDAIECGIVKLPRVPIADNIPGGDSPMFRNLWEHIRDKMPKKGRGQTAELDPLSLPPQLQTALEALYGHYERTFELWQKSGLKVPPCFIVVCNNTAASKLVYDYISGFHRSSPDGKEHFNQGRLPLFRNFDENGTPLARPNTLLIDSEQLESGDALDVNFRTMAADEIERFRREIVERTGDLRKGESITDQELLREVMNTVGRPGKLGESIRCVVSVSMLTEGWDTNTVTHVLGVRAFGTQLLCEQVIGRALRRQSYDINEKGLFDVEYADVLGIPFDFTAEPVPAPPQPPRETVQVKAISPERDHLEITFPRVTGYRIELPNEELTATFNDDSILELTPDLIGATITKNAGIIGAHVDLTLNHTADTRPSQVLYELTQYLILHKWRDSNGDPMLNFFGQLKRIARQWIDTCLKCSGGTFPAQLKYKNIADMACERIIAGISRQYVGKGQTTVVLDPYNPIGSTSQVHFNSSAPLRWETSPDKSHVNWAILHSGWEGELCRVLESHPQVKFYVKNHGLSFEIPYRVATESKRYIPDFIVKIDDGNGPDDLLNLIIEVKGERGESEKDKKAAVETQWLPGVNYAKRFGRWSFIELLDKNTFESELNDFLKNNK